MIPKSGYRLSEKIMLKQRNILALAEATALIGAEWPSGLPAKDEVFGADGP
jgi:hypothetical protein